MCMSLLEALGVVTPRPRKPWSQVMKESGVGVVTMR
jgi:hypothetical protein